MSVEIVNQFRPLMATNSRTSFCGPACCQSNSLFRGFHSTCFQKHSSHDRKCLLSTYSDPKERTPQISTIGHSKGSGHRSIHCTHGMFCYLPDFLNPCPTTILVYNLLSEHVSPKQEQPCFLHKEHRQEQNQIQQQQQQQSQAKNQANASNRSS